MTSEWDATDATIKDLRKLMGEDIDVPESTSGELARACRELEQVFKNKDTASKSSALEKIRATLKSAGRTDEEIEYHIKSIKTELQQRAGS